MSSQLENELRAAFEAASDFVQPRPGLAQRVRRGSHRHRQRLMAGLAAATACALVAAGGAYAAIHGQSRGPAVVAASGRGSRVLITFPRGYTPGGLVASGKYLYATTILGSNGPMVLSAYSRLTGRLVRQFTFPANDLAETTVGPGGSVWVVVAPTGNFGPVRVWLFSAGLQQHSVGPWVQSTFLLPISRTMALVPVARGLLRLQMPAPGTAGHASQYLEPGTSLGAGAVTEALGAAVPLDGRVAVEVTNNSNPDQYYFVIAGHPGTRFDTGSSNYPAAVADGSLWTVTGGIEDASLVRLNAELEPTTPGFITSSRLLKRDVLNVTSYGDTVWVSRNTGKDALACFSASSAGPIVTLPVKGYAFIVAAAGRTVYVVTDKTLSSNPGRTVTSYPVPAACR